MSLLASLHQFMHRAVVSPEDLAADRALRKREREAESSAESAMADLKLARSTFDPRADEGGAALVALREQLDADDEMIRELLDDE